MRYEIRNVSEALETKQPWPLTTVAWSVIVGLIPVNYAIGPIARGAWFAAIGIMILVPLLLHKVARPLYPVVWIFAGYASVVAVVLATNRSTISANLFVGAQLVLLLGIGPFVLTYNALIDSKFAQRVFVPFIVTQTLSSFVGLLQSAGYVAVTHVAGDVNWWGRFPGLSEHQNSLGIFATSGVLLSLQLFVRSHTLGLRGLAAGAASVNAIGIVVSGSFTAVLALLFGLTVAILASANRHQSVAILLAGVACAFTVWSLAAFTGASSYLPSFVNRYLQVTGQLYNAGADSGSVAGRFYTWQLVLNQDPHDLLFGGGLTEAAGDVWTMNVLTTVHNLVFKAWYQGGITLGVAFALIAAAILTAAIRAIARREFGTEAGVAVAMLTYATFSPLLEQRQFWLPTIVAWSSMSAAALRSRDRGICATEYRYESPTFSVGHVKSSLVGYKNDQQRRAHAGTVVLRR